MEGKSSQRLTKGISLQEAAKPLSIRNTQKIHGVKTINLNENYQIHFVPIAENRKTKIMSFRLLHHNYITAVIVILCAWSIALPSSAFDLLQPSQVADRPIGSPTAPITLIEYSSPTCGHCVEYRNTVAPHIYEEFVIPGTVRVIFRPFARNNIDLVIFMLAEWNGGSQFHTILDHFYSKHQEIVESDNVEKTLREIAFEMGIDQASFDLLVKNQSTLDALNGLRSQAVKEFTVNGTPTFFINNRKINGALSLEEMRNEIENTLRRL